MFSLLLCSRSSSNSIRLKNNSALYWGRHSTANNRCILRGISQPLIKIGLIGWPSPVAAVTIGYITSSLAIGLFAFFRGEKALRLPLSGVAWFTATGLVNGLAVLLLYMALELGSVAVVAPLIACYPLFTLILNRIFFGDSGLSNLSVAGIGLTVFGISLLLSSSMV